MAEAPQAPRGATEILAGDRWNALFVRDWRAAMRSKLFQVGYLVLLGISLVGSLGCLLQALITGDQARLGQTLAMLGAAPLIFYCLGLAPLLALHNMTAEWERSTYEMLSISALRPGRILLGKWLGAQVQSWMFLCALVPFLFASILLPGVNPVGVLVVVALLPVGSAALCCLALGIATLTRQRPLRVLLLALYSMGLFGVCSSAVGSMSLLLGSSNFDLRDHETWVAILFCCGLATLVGSLGFALALSRLLHPEENRSAPLRRAALSSLALMVVGLWTLYSLVHQPEALHVPCRFLLLVLPVCCCSFCSEPPYLGRRVAIELQGRALRGWLSTLLLPGGARGLLFSMVWLGLFPLLVLWPLRDLPAQALAVDAPGVLETIFQSVGSCLGGEAPELFQRFEGEARAPGSWWDFWSTPACLPWTVLMLESATLISLAIVFLGLPTALLDSLSGKALRWRVLSGLSPILLLLLCVGGLALGALLTEWGREFWWQLPLNPVRILNGLNDADAAEAHDLGWIFLLASAVLALNLPRLVVALKQQARAIRGKPAQ